MSLRLHAARRRRPCPEGIRPLPSLPPGIGAPDCRPAGRPDPSARLPFLPRTGPGRLVGLAGLRFLALERFWPFPDACLLLAAALLCTRLLALLAASPSGSAAAGWPCSSGPGCPSSAGSRQAPAPRHPVTPAPLLLLVLEILCGFLQHLREFFKSRAGVLGGLLQGSSAFPWTIPVCSIPAFRPVCVVRSRHRSVACSASRAAAGSSLSDC